MRCTGNSQNNAAKKDLSGVHPVSDVVPTPPSTSSGAATLSTHTALADGARVKLIMRTRQLALAGGSAVATGLRSDETKRVLFSHMNR